MKLAALAMRLQSGRWRLTAALLLGAAGVFAFEPFGLFWLALPLWCGLFCLMRQAPTPRAAALSGFVFGLGFFLGGVSWVYVSLSVFGGMPLPLAALATLLYCGVLALFPLLAGWAFKRWQPAALWRQALWFGVLCFAADWARGWVFTGFPWLSLGYTQTPPSPLAGFAPLLGVYGLSLLTATLAALLVCRRVGWIALGLALAVGAGLRQVEWTSPVGTPVAVALVQGNVAQEMKFRPENFIRTLLLYHSLVERHPAQLTVLPETAVPSFYDQLPEEFVAEMQRLAKRRGGDLIFGVATGDGGQYRNSAVTLGAAQQQMYHKRHLVPFGEFIPPGFGWFLTLARIPLSDFARGEAVQAPLAIAGQQVAANICYEDVFGEEIIAALPQATLLVNLSNTAWFGDSLAQPQHLQIARMRALETGRPMLRATNTGMTAVVAHDGNVQAALPAFTRGVLQASISGRTGATPYILYGNAPALVLAALLALLALRPGRRQ